MIGAVLGPISDRLIPVAAWLIGASPLSMPIYASWSLLSLSELPAEMARAVPRAFHFWLFVTLLVTAWLLIRLWNSRRAMAKAALENPA